MADIASDVEQQALEPVSVTTDGQNSTGRTMADVEKGIQLAANLRAMALRRRGVRFSKMIPSGPAGEVGCTPLDSAFNRGCC